MGTERKKQKPFRLVETILQNPSSQSIGTRNRTWNWVSRHPGDAEKESMMNKMYDAIMKMEKMLDAYESLIDDLTTFLKDNGIDITGDPTEHPALMLYAEAGRIYGRLLHTRKLEDLLRMEGEYRLMTSMLAEMKAGAWMAKGEGEIISKVG